MKSFHDFYSERHPYAVMDEWFEGEESVGSTLTRISGCLGDYITIMINERLEQFKNDLDAAKKTI